LVMEVKQKKMEKENPRRIKETKKQNKIKEKQQKNKNSILIKIEII